MEHHADGETGLLVRRACRSSGGIGDSLASPLNEVGHKPTKTCIAAQRGQSSLAHSGIDVGCSSGQTVKVELQLSRKDMLDERLDLDVASARAIGLVLLVLACGAVFVGRRASHCIDFLKGKQEDEQKIRVAESLRTGLHTC